MKSLLDNGHSWVLDRIEYSDGLNIYLQELKRAPIQDADIGGSTFRNVYPLRADESSGFLAFLSSSAYLSYVLSNHGWYVEVQERPVCHYRVWSENEILDVVAFGAPVIETVHA